MAAVPLFPVWKKYARYKGTGKGKLGSLISFSFLQQRHEARVRFSLSGCGSSRGILLSEEEFYTVLTLIKTNFNGLVNISF